MCEPADAQYIYIKAVLMVFIYKKYFYFRNSFSIVTNFLFCLRVYDDVENSFKLSQSHCYHLSVSARAHSFKMAFGQASAHTPYTYDTLQQMLLTRNL